MTTDLQPHEPVDLGQAAPIVAPADPPTTAQTPSADATDAPTPPEPSARDLQMRAIIESRERKIAQELAYGETLQDEAHDVATGVQVGTAAAAREAGRAAAGALDDQPKPVGTAPAPTATLPATEPAQQPQPTTPGTPVVSQRRLRTINGQQFAFTDEEWDQLAQTGAIATIQHNQRLQQQSQQPQQPQPQPQPQQPAPQPVQAPPAFDDAAALELVRRLSYGHENEAASALRTVYERARDDAVAQLRGQQQQYNPDQLADAIEHRVMQRTLLQNNLLTLGNEYPDIFHDVTLSQLAALKLHDVRGEDAVLNRQRTELELYREACNRVRAVLGPQTGTALTQPQSAPQPAPQAAAPQQQMATSATRVTRKREAPSQPRSVNQTAPIEDNEKRMTSSEIVQSYRKARGQAAMH